MELNGTRRTHRGDADRVVSPESGGQGGAKTVMAPRRNQAAARVGAKKTWASRSPSFRTTEGRETPEMAATTPVYADLKG